MADALEQQARCIGWLEASFAWLLSVGETAKAGAVYPVLSELVMERDEALLGQLQAQQASDAADLMAGTA